MTILRHILDALGFSDPPAPAPVDIARMLDERARAHEARTDWRHSVVDLMRLLDMDSGLDERQALAAELGWPGNPSATGAMNVWRHREIMMRVRENGGVVPAELL